VRAQTYVYTHAHKYTYVRTTHIIRGAMRSSRKVIAEKTLNKRGEVAIRQTTMLRNGFVCIHNEQVYILTKGDAIGIENMRA